MLREDGCAYMVVKELGLKEIATPLQSLEGVAGGGTLGTINQFATTLNELLKNGLTLFQTISGNKTGAFPAIGQQAQTGQPAGNIVNPIAPTQTTLSKPAQPINQAQNSENTYKTITDVLGLLTKLNSKMTVTELLNEMKTNKAQVIEGITKGMGGGNDKPKG